MTRTNKVLAAFGFLATTAYGAPVYAYLDPGTGSILLQGLLAGIAGAMVVGKLYWMRLKAFFSSMFLGNVQSKKLFNSDPANSNNTDSKE